MSTTTTTSMKFLVGLGRAADSRYYRTMSRGRPVHIGKSSMTLLTDQNIYCFLSKVDCTKGTRGFHTTTAKTGRYENDDEENKRTPPQDQHAFYKQQLIEMEAERTILSGEGAAASTETLTMKNHGTALPSSFATTEISNSDFIQQMQEWKQEQTHVFGQELDDEIDTQQMQQQQQQPSNQPVQESDSHNHQEGMVSEEQKEERELLFQFTSHEISSWGQERPSTQSMQDVIRQVAEARMELDGTNDNEKGISSTKEESVENTPSAPLTSITESPPSHQDLFSHVSGDGNSVNMVDVGHKSITQRMAHAQTKVLLPSSVVAAFSSSSKELVGPKGPIFSTAKIAGIMAAKQTSNLIPLCHPLPLDQVQVDICLQNDNVVVIDCRCRVTHKTGVEMEALTGATVAALSIYDMVKAVSHEILIQETRLISKAGGKRLVQDGQNVSRPEKANTTPTMTHKDSDEDVESHMYLHVGPSGDVWTGRSIFAAKHLQPDYVKSIPLEDEPAVLQNSLPQLVELLEENPGWARDLYDTGRIPDAVRQHFEESLKGKL